VDAVHVPYKGLSEVVTGVLAGQVTFGFGAIEGLMPDIQDGQLRALAVTSEKRFPLLPELPTMIESGVDGFVVSSFQGVVAPAGTPPAVVARLNAAVNASMEAPEMRAQLARRRRARRRNSRCSLRRRHANGRRSSNPPASASIRLNSLPRKRGRELDFVRGATRTAPKLTTSARWP
jgi:Tripartite tricarboxylate transporter family receptor